MLRVLLCLNTDLTGGVGGWLDINTFDTLVKYVLWCHCTLQDINS